MKEENKKNTVPVYVQLLDEGTPTIIGMQAVPLADGTYRLLSSPTYDPESETWEFPPNTIVRCRMHFNKMPKNSFHKSQEILLAYERVD